MAFLNFLNKPKNELEKGGRAAAPLLPEGALPMTGERSRAGASQVHT